ncbi:hypothetical protein SAMN05421830_101214 [Desulfomicrobium norvegicum]|uniref:PilZ domain-containing protein n=1 Tax=Desulfomicrobium norvegicum (strain DSM 1741 / NCIMB 8310) TaxID=52561 RepID=A0A8G2BZK9_DESNO|nr:hypothetical protein [Desulfomicrobium norvegicum]SFL26175.1 hypothetical protein SAMN05421830_101214 [Desulfomicrobium norvegicum]
MLEKRKWPRFACLEPCDLLPVTNNAAKRPSRILNYCFNGLLLETDIPLGTGQYIKVDVQGNALGNKVTGIGKRVGLVRWCSTRPVQSSDCFEMGIEMLGGVSDEVLG